MNKIQFRTADIFWCVAAVTVFSVPGFYAGGQLERASIAKNSNRPTHSKLAGHYRRNLPESVDLEAVLINRVATIGFAELYDLMEVASPDLRLKWMRQIEAMQWSPDRTAALTTFYKTWLQLDAAAAIAWLSHCQDQSDRLLVIPILTGAAMPSVLGDVTRVLFELPRNETVRGHGPDYLGNAVDEWSWADPVALSHFVEEHKADGREWFAETLMSSWSAIDPAAAKAWLDVFDPQHHNTDAVKAWLNGWFESEQPSAIAYIVTHFTDAAAVAVIPYYANALFDESPDKARGFINQLPTEEARNNAIKEIASSAGFEWGHPADVVLSWLTTLPPADWKGQIGSALNGWEEKDATGFVRWVTQLPDEARDQVVVDYCSYSYSEDLIGRKLGLAMTISDASLREGTLRNFLDWVFGDASRNDVFAKIRQTDLSPSAKAYILKLVSTKN